ncbi:invasion associated locus B family protein [Rhizobium sp. HT1-10]|uniref:invasion associated locus B family protein n=1 Tax=Rhizobium sp. HT1-10 TaxID=3111638 RepID=UPI003C2680DE
MPAKTPILAVAALVASALSAHAEPSRIQQYDDWGVYSYAAKSGTVCYALSMPKKMEPAGIDHGKNYFLVSPASNGGGFVPEAVRGYMLKPGAPITVAVDDKRFAMVSKDNAAWVRDEAKEPDLVAAMRDGSDMTVSATSKRGTSTRYTYSLAGISAALKKVSACR